MKIVFLSIAGFTIKLAFESLVVTYAKDKLLEEISSLYKGFIIKNPSEKIDFIITIGEPSHHFVKKKRKDRTYYLSYLFSIDKNKDIYTTYDVSIHQLSHLIMNLIQEKLVKENGFLLHASAAHIQGKAYLFTGVSGAGKSTIVSLLHPFYTALSDDMCVIKKENNSYIFYQTPFIEKNNWMKKSRKKYQFGGLFLLKKSSNYKIEKIQSKRLITLELVKQLRAENNSITSTMKNVFSFVNSFHNFNYLYFAKNRLKIRKLLFDWKKH